MRTLICLVGPPLFGCRSPGLQPDGGAPGRRRTAPPDSRRPANRPALRTAHPPRVVLDLFGINASLAEMPAPSAGGPAIEVRTGEHPNFLRVVVDLTEALPGYQVRQAEDLIQVGLGSAALPSSADGVLIESSPVPADPSRPPRRTAPVVAVGVEASPASAAEPRAVQAIAAPVAAGDRARLEDLSTDELMALIEEELKAAGEDQEQSAEELIEEIEAELDANDRRSTTSSPPPARRAPPQRRPRPTPTRSPPADGEERLPFRYVDEEPAKEPPPA